MVGYHLGDLVIRSLLLPERFVPLIGGWVVVEQEGRGTEQLTQKEVCEIVSLPGYVPPLPLEVFGKTMTKGNSKKNGVSWYHLR